jgi:hypothetical protein
MDLTSLEKIDNSIRRTSWLALAFCVIVTTASTISFYYLSNKIDEIYTKALVIDTRGNTYQTAVIPAKEMRIYEYENHVKTFVNLWYAFDESNYEKNIEAGLHLIGDMGKELLNEYNDVAILGSLIQKNIRYGVSIKDITIDMETLPVSGTLQAIQTGYRARGSISRNMRVSFTLYDVARSRENVHGCKISEWKVKFIKQEDNDEK